MEMLRLACTLSVFALGFAAMASGDQPASNHPPSTPPNYEALLQRAKNARADNPASVRAVVDAVFDAGLFRRMPASVRDRLTKADVAYRRGKARGIKQQDIAEAMNQFAPMLGANVMSDTSVGQIQRYRHIVRAMVPLIGAENGRPGRVEAEMSPAEAMLIISALVTQKMLNPHYKVSPEEWCHKFDDKANRGQHGEDQPGAQQGVGQTGPTLHLVPVDNATTAALNALANDLGSESDVMTYEIHLLLDQLGVSR